MSVGKIKAGIKQATTMKGIPRVLMHLGIGFVIGTIIDLLLNHLITMLIPEETAEARGINVGFSIYYRNPASTYIPYDDLILLIVTVIALFTKKFWLVIGFFLGWYVSSNEGLYGRLVTPFTPTEATP